MADLVTATPPATRGEVQPDFWHGKRVFVLGHTGFKGSWLSLWLQRMGAHLTGFALAPPSEPAMFDAASVAEGMESVIGDIRDAAAVTRALVEAQPEIVIHMAAQALVRPSYDDPVGTYATNVLGTVHVLEAVRATPTVKAVVSVTTDKCYQNREWHWGYREGEPLGGRDPYSSSKACAELVGDAYRSSFLTSSGVALASARAGNVVGGGDWARDRLLPDILGAFDKGEAVRIRAPHAIRPWQHVLEPLSGYLVLCQALWDDGDAFAEAWNFGPQDADARPVQWIVEHMASRWSGEASWEIDGSGQPHEARFLKLDISKAADRLAWRPKWRLDETLDRVVNWHAAWRAGQDMRAYSLGEIADYASARNSAVTASQGNAQSAA